MTCVWSLLCAYVSKRVRAEQVSQIDLKCDIAGRNSCWFDGGQRQVISDFRRWQQWFFWWDTIVTWYPLLRRFAIINVPYHVKRFWMICSFPLLTSVVEHSSWISFIVVYWRRFSGIIYCIIFMYVCSGIMTRDVISQHVITRDQMQ